MNFRAPFNFRASHNLRGIFVVLFMRNIDKEGENETKLELLFTFGVHSSQILHLNSLFSLNRGRFARNEY